MTGKEALFELLINDRPVRRRAWVPGRFLYYDDGELSPLDSLGYIFLFETYRFDFNQNDWEFYDEVSR